jgi:hypothetical protein
MTKQEQSAYWNSTLSEMADEQLAFLFKYFAGLPFNDDVAVIMGYFAAEFTKRPHVLNQIAEAAAAKHNK